MTRSFASLAVILALVGAALFVASPGQSRTALEWMPTLNFSLGVGLITVAFLEIGRAALAWFSRRATLRWLLGSALGGLGLFIAGSSSMVHARDLAFDWLAIAGIGVALAGIWLRRHAGVVRAGPA
jgi:drug/metabolite transporter (DMT)-like permease